MSLVFLCPPLSSSTSINVRTKRSKSSVTQSKRTGCSLGTCMVHDLAHRLHQLNNKLRIGSAPIDKISPQGYGRRRRSLPAHRVTLRLEQGRLRPVWSKTDSQVHKLEALLRRTWAGLCERRLEQKRRSSSDSLLCSKNSPNASDSCQVFSSTFSRHEDWVRARLAALSFSGSWAERLSDVKSANSWPTGTGWYSVEQLQVLLSAWQRERKSANTWPSGDTYGSKRGSLF